MKYIFDFDDLLFYTTKHRKEHMFVILEKAGIPKEKLEEYYKTERENQFSLKKLLKHFLIPEKLYEEIMDEVKNFKNEELLKVIEKLGKSNCYLVTYGEEEFQMDKIKRTDMADLFSKIITVQGSKKEAVEEICAKHKDETVIFIDDKAHHFKDLDFKKYPNLVTILYDEDGLKKFKDYINNI